MPNFWSGVHCGSRAEAGVELGGDVGPVAVVEVLLLLGAPEDHDQHQRRDSRGGQDPPADARAGGGDQAGRDADQQQRQLQ